MKATRLNFSAPVCLVGGGHLTRKMLDEARAIAPIMVAADGAADRLAEFDVMPDAIIGDMDSIVEPAHWRTAACEFLQIDEQDSTDFGKCIYATDAPFYVAVGFTGGRLDHSLAVLSAMLEASDKVVILIGEDEVSTFVPPSDPLNITLDEGAVVSIFPMAPVKGTVSLGLKWSVADLELQVGQRVGTSNVAIAPNVTIGFDRAGALLMVGRQYLKDIIKARIT